MKQFYLFILALVCISGPVKSNNIALANLSTSFNQSTGVVTANFDLSWENSWRTNAINNWDAAWVFFKYLDAGVWKHLDLTGYNISLPNGYTYSVPNDKKGIFIYRDAPGSGNASLTGCQVGVVPQMGTYDIKAFGLEMVYHPDGAFYLGDGSNGSYGNYRTGGTLNPFLVGYTSGDQIPYGNTYAWELYDSLNLSGSMSSGWPTGYTAFYAMKYELSQAGYRDFLNTLTYQQQQTRTINAPNSSAGTLIYGATINYRQAIKIVTPGSSPGTAAVYGCDLNNNGVYNEYDDGEWIPVTYINGADMCAYLDWSGLRPLTEMEFEKMCRGNKTAYPNEYAWGSNFVDTTVFSLSGDGKSGEVITNTVVNGSANFYIRSLSIGPLRNGIFATSSSSRSSAGAGFYGVMELSGNLYELVINSTTAAGKSFTGLHGNGTLNLNGDADVDYWPGINGNNSGNSPNGAYLGSVGCNHGTGLGRRGGTFYWHNDLMRASDRYLTSDRPYYRIQMDGIRGGRTAY